MKVFGLASVLSALALLGAASRAQTPSFDPKTGGAVSAARETLNRFDSAMAPLRRGDYEKKNRRPILPILVRLESQLEAFPPPAAQGETRRAEDFLTLRKDVLEAVRGEKEFWAGLPDPDTDEARKLPAESVDGLNRRATRITAAFAGLFPERVRPGFLAAAGRSGGASDRLPSRSAQAVARAAARGKAASARPEQFFDGTVSRGGRTASSGPAAAAARPDAGSGTDERDSSLPVEPAASLRVNAVPRPAPAPRRRSWDRSRDELYVLHALSAAAPGALRDAVRSTPVLTGAVAALPRAKTAPPPPPARAAPDAPPPAAPSAETIACLQTVTEHPSVAGLCRNSPTVAPLLAGLLEALEDQFGTAQGLVINLAYLLLGLVMSALTGFGVIAKVVVSLASFAMLIGTVYPLLKQGYEAVKGLLTTKSGDVRHSQSLLSIGKLGGTVLIMALMAAIGWGLGKTAAGKEVMGSTTDAVSAKLAGLGLKDGLAALDARVPASVKGFLGGPTPAEDASISGFGSALGSLPRIGKSALLFSEETLRRNAGISDRETRIGAAMTQLSVDRAFAERVANAHDQVPCRAGECTKEQLRRKAEIMGPGPQAEFAIRSGLAVGPPTSGLPGPK